jgi:tRNA-dihydrouridine synthase
MGYKNLLDERASFSMALKRQFDSELAQYRSAAQATQTDRIKFGVLEEWIHDVFKLNNLKFSDKDFIEKSEEQMLREKIAKEIEDAVIEVAGNSAETMRQAARIVRGDK